MRSSSGPTSCCRYCQYYTPEGRRGGQCSQLSVPVQGAWEACPLALQAFAPTWEDPILEGVGGAKVIANAAPANPLGVSAMVATPVNTLTPVATPVLVSVAHS
ncbi:MAG: hypothetical protein HC835_12605 [Oscillatoriales cyanobacterium RM2_1_1]|nr:hypothetical protein [Oscillatoriales cyanobacterium SM2_3_0]NJO46393.1 hypothetical protein [Oscillatoriales cyanobacterium RM2_1_1]